MARITELPAADAVTGSETVPIVQDGVMKRGALGDVVGGLAQPFVDQAQDHALDAMTARDVALTAGPHYVSIAAGEGETITGQTFAVAPSDGSVKWYRRTGGGSTEIFELATLGFFSAPTAASIIGCKQTVLSSVSRTVQSKLSECISVLDFGADPTGAADSTSAFQAAAAANLGGEVIVPAGTYLVGNIGWLNYAGTRWRGASKYTTILKVKAGTTGAILSNTNSNGGTSAYCAVEALSFDLRGEDCVAIDLASLNNCAIRDCFGTGGIGFGSPTTTNGSPIVTLTGMGGEDTTRVRVGQVLFGPDIPAGTIVLSIQSATQFTMSANATGSGHPVYAVAGTLVRCAAPLDQGAYTNKITDCAGLYLERAFVTEDAGNENTFDNCEAIACGIGFDVENGVDTARIIHGRAEGCNIGLRNGGRETIVIAVRFENNFAADISFTAGATRASFFACYTATSVTTFLNPSNCVGLFSRGGTFPQRDYEPNVSNPILSAARQTFAAAGSTPANHGLVNYSVYFQDYPLLKNGISAEFSNAAADNSIIGMHANGADEIEVSCYNRKTAAFVPFKAANGTLTINPTNKTLQLSTTTVAALPAAGTAGRRAVVTDASVAYVSANVGSTVASGGANRVPVFDNGMNWVIG